jgi:hypothetical protein
MSTMNLSLGKGQLVHKADNLTTICEQIVSQHRGPPWPVTGTDLPLPIILEVVASF